MTEGSRQPAADNEREDYERFYRDDLRAQLTEFIEEWQEGTRASSLRWRVDEVDVDIEVRSLRLAPRRGRKLAEVHPLRPAPTRGARVPRLDARTLALEAFAAASPDALGAAEICRLLEEHGLAASRTSVNTMLSRLRNGGELVRVARGRYTAGGAVIDGDSGDAA